MSVPSHVRKALRSRLWYLADQIGWLRLSSAAKTKYYEQWTRNPDIGGLLARYLDRGQIRVYLKDTLLKDYPRQRLADRSRPFRVLKLPHDTQTVETYIKPHGRRLEDGRVICWGRADDWKSVLMALHERTYKSPNLRPHAAVLVQSTGRFHQRPFRRMVQDAASKLGIEKAVWLET